jgi:hypothetical protein
MEVTSRLALEDIGTMGPGNVEEMWRAMVRKGIRRSWCEVPTRAIVAWRKLKTAIPANDARLLGD